MVRIVGLSVMPGNQTLLRMRIFIINIARLSSGVLAGR